jgi:ABC-type lipoprotein export system ATPase subunit
MVPWTRYLCSSIANSFSRVAHRTEREELATWPQSDALRPLLARSEGDYLTLPFASKPAAAELGRYWHSGRVGVVVRARGVVKVYGQGRAAVRVLDGLDLDVHSGELVAVTGRSGSGKSTLLNVIGALDRVDGGSVELCGVRIDRSSERELAPLRRDRIGFVFQSFHLLPELTGLENVLLPARLNGRRPSRERGLELVERLGLGAAAERLPAVLSGGEQQRLAIARALVNDPQLVLADEPTGNLDVESGQAVLDLLRSIADESRAVLLVTHEREATRRSDRVLRLEGGRLT